MNDRARMCDMVAERKKVLSGFMNEWRGVFMPLPLTNKITRTTYAFPSNNSNTYILPHRGYGKRPFSSLTSSSLSPSASIQFFNAAVMAANEYYNSINAPGVHSTRQYPRSSTNGGYYSSFRPPPPKPSPYASQSSLASSNSGRFVGVNNDYGQYAEDIPLNNSAPPLQQQPWPPPTQYPGPYYGQPFIDEAGPRRRGRRSGGIWSRIPWVTYTLSLCQIIVFIVELVKNGKPALGNNKMKMTC